MAFTSANPTADFGGVIGRSRGVADKMSKGIQFLMKKNKIDVIMGFGKLIAPGKLEVTAADGSKQSRRGKKYHHCYWWPCKGIANFTN